MKASVTGATGFVGAHVARALAERGDEVRVVYRNPDRLDALRGVKVGRAKADVLDYPSLRRAVRDCEVLFHTAGYVGSRPAERLWQLNAHAPVIAVEAAAAEGSRRVVITSTISAIGLPRAEDPADEATEYPEDWLGLAYPDSKHAGERAALAAGERHGVEVVVVNPAYVLGVPVNRDQPGETSTRTIGNYLGGPLPGVIDAPMNFADVGDVVSGHSSPPKAGRPASATSWAARTPLGPSSSSGSPTSPGSASRSSCSLRASRASRASGRRSGSLGRCLQRRPT